MPKGRSSSKIILNRIYRMNRSKVLKYAILSVAGAFLLSTVISLVSLHSMVRHNQRELNKVLAAQIYDTISIELSEPAVIARTMSYDRFLIELLENERSYPEEEITRIMEEYLSGIRSGLDYESSFVVSDESRRYYAYNGLNKIIDPDKNPFDAWYTEFLGLNEEYAVDVDNDEVNPDIWTVFVNSRITSPKGKFLGVCGVGFHMTKSQELFASLEEEHHVKIRLIDPNRMIQVDTDADMFGTELPDEINLPRTDSTSYVYQDLGGGKYSVIKYMDSLGWYLVVTNDGTNERSQFVHIIILNLLFFGLSLLILIPVLRFIMRRTNDLTNASYRDQTTHLLNRRAFEEEKGRLEEERLPDDFVYLIADVNGLKTVNDTIGHHAGDELISGAASILKEILGEYGNIYRVGGDEFSALLRVRPENLDALMEKLQRAFDGWSGEQVRELAVSCGCASRKEFPSETIIELGRIADERMYRAKDEYYTSSGKDRRQH